MKDLRITTILMWTVYIKGFILLFNDYIISNNGMNKLFNIHLIRNYWHYSLTGDFVQTSVWQNESNAFIGMDAISIPDVSVHVGWWHVLRLPDRNVSPGASLYHCLLWCEILSHYLALKWDKFEECHMHLHVPNNITGFTYVSVN